MSPGDVSPIKPVVRRVEKTDESPTRPVAPPKSDKDFKKIASRRERPADTDAPSEEGEEVAGVGEEEAPVASIFALAAASGLKKTKPDRSALSDGEEMNVADLLKEPKPVLKKKEEGDEEGAWEGEIEKSSAQKKSTEPSVRSQFGENRPDLAGFPPILRAEEVQQSLSVKVPVDPKPVLRDLAAELIKEIQTLRTGDKTDTIVTLRFPPLFEGATVKLTTMDSAKREFDILFANLSDQAKLLLDNKLANDSLMLALERKGFQVHTIATTTQNDVPLQVEGDSATGRQAGEGKGGEERRGNTSKERQGS